MVLVLGNSADVYCAVAQAQSLSQVKSSQDSAPPKVAALYLQHWAMRPRYWALQLTLPPTLPSSTRDLQTSVTVLPPDRARQGLVGDDGLVSANGVVGDRRKCCCGRWRGVELQASGHYLETVYYWGVAY